MARVNIPGATSQTVFEKLDQRFSIQDTGMVPDCLQGVRGAMTSGGHTLTVQSPDPLFTPAYIGKVIAVYGAGAMVYGDVGHTLAVGEILLTTITAVAGGGLSCTTAAAAVHTVTEAQWATGTDNTPMFNDCMTALRIAGGGVLHWDKPGQYFFATSGFTNLFGWYFVDHVDFSGCRIIQGEHTKIVIGYPMQFLSINDEVFNKWNLTDAGSPPTTDIVLPVKEGDLLVYCDPAQMVSGGQPLYHRNDWILILTGYVIDTWFGFGIPDAQIVQIVYADTVTGQVILAEPTLKPFIQETYPSPGGWSGPSGDAPFAIINVTDILIHDFRYENLYIDSFFFTLALIYGGQVHGCYLEGVRGNMRGGFHAMNYVHTGRTSNVRVFIDNLVTPRTPDYDYAWTVAVGTSHVRLENSEINSTGKTYLHFHEGAANCSANHVRTGFFNGTISPAVQPVSIRARSYGLRLTDCHFIGYDALSVIYIAKDCTAGGAILNCSIGGRSASTYHWDIECFGAGWRIDCPNIDPSRIYAKSVNDGQWVKQMDPLVLLAGAEGTRGLGTTLGGHGIAGNINIYSDNLPSASWGGSDVTVTANSTDVLDPVGTNTSTKIVVGVTTAAAYNRDYSTPDPGSTVRAGGSSATNSGRSFVLSFYARADQDTPMEVLIEAFFFGVGPDLSNQFFTTVVVSSVWKRFDVEVAFGMTISTEIVIGVVQGSNLFGAGRTFYFWGVTFQEKHAELMPVVTRTSGTAAPYFIGSLVSVALKFPTLTVSRVLKLGSTGVATTALVDVNSTSDIEATGFNTNDFAKWDGSKFVGAVPSSAPPSATYITQTPDSGLSAEQALSALATGILKNTTGTGVLSVAAFADLPAPSVWSSFTTTVTSLTSTTIRGKYQQIGKTVNFNIYVKGTTNGSGTLPTFTLPVTPASDDFTFASYRIVASNLFTNPNMLSSGVIILNVGGAGALTISTQFEFVFTGSYEAA